MGTKGLAILFNSYLSAISTVSSLSGKSIDSFEGPGTKYEIRIKTGDEPGAGSSDVPDAFIKFVGENEISTRRIDLVLPQVILTFLH